MYKHLWRTMVIGVEYSGNNNSVKLESITEIVRVKIVRFYAARFICIVSSGYERVTSFSVPSKIPLTSIIKKEKKI